MTPTIRNHFRRAPRRRAGRVVIVQELERRALMAPLVVDTTADTGAGSLRQAILDANTAGGGTIDFAIAGTGPFLIRPATPLPAMTGPTTIDGYSQVGSSPNTLARGDDAAILIRLDGVFVPQADGLVLGGGNSLVRGLDITGFSDGVRLAVGGGDAVEGNFLGVDTSGTTVDGNSADGLLADGVAGFTVGGAAPADRNVIAGNGPTSGHGTSEVELIGDGAASYVIRGNYIGTDRTGEVDLAIPFTYQVGVQGLTLENAPGATVGGTTPGAGNVVSGSEGVTISEAIGGDLIQGNFLGVDVTGTRPLGGSGFGLSFTGGSGTTIGGTTAGASNVATGINVTANGDVIQGNFIGTDHTGTLTVGTGGGIIANGSGNTIGGAIPGAGNVVQGGIGVGGDDVVIQGNFVGSDITGTRALGTGGGINLAGANDTIGGTAPGAGNVISNGSGISISSAPSDPRGDLIQGNRIGTDITGTVALGNVGYGILMVNEHNITVGGTAPGAANVIANNRSGGILLHGDSDVIQGNFIGTDVTGTRAMPNSGNGVWDVTGSSDTIGGTAPGAGNVIADNAGDGVLTGIGAIAGGHNNVILSNSITNNGNLGIELFGQDIHLNTPMNPLNFPYPTSAVVTPAGIVISGTLNSAADAQATIQFFANVTPGRDNYGQGRTYLGQVIVTTDAAGNARFTATFPYPAAAGRFVATTATTSVPDGGTSEFSFNVPASTGPALPKAPGDYDGLGLTDVAYYDPTTATFAVIKSDGSGTIVQPLGNPAHRDIPLAGDYFVPGRTDFAVYDPVTSTFLIKQSGGVGQVSLQFGDPSHHLIPLVGDYDGDGRTDIGYYDPTSSTFVIIPSAGGLILIRQFGFIGRPNIPLAGDYDGTGRTNIGVYDQSNSTFAYISTTTGQAVVTPFGFNGHGNVPLSGDYDGAGRTNIGIFDPTNSTFAYLATGTGQVVVKQLGYVGHGNVPLAADYDGDGRTDFAYFDPTSSTFAALLSGGGQPLVQPFGYLGHGNEPIPAPAIIPGVRAGAVAVVPAARPTSVPAGPMRPGQRFGRPGLPEAGD